MTVAGKIFQIPHNLDEVLAWIDLCSDCNDSFKCLPSELLMQSTEDRPECRESHVKDLLTCALLSKSWCYPTISRLWANHGDLDTLFQKVLTSGYLDESTEVFLDNKLPPFLLIHR